MTIEEAIKTRIERFNRLYKAAVGHTFEEDPKWCEDKIAEEKPAWLEKLKVVLEKNGFASAEDYYESIYKDREDGNRIAEIDEILREEPRHLSLYGYEMLVINQAKSIAEFLHESNEEWNKYANNSEGNYVGSFQFIKNLKQAGYKEWNEDHSGNSAGMSILFANALINNRDLFQYLHWSLSPLVGDAGYHDDRSDIPNN